MNLRHLRYFVALAEELHFGRAAERVFVVQPALSQQIARLEKELGVGLVTRTKRRVALTDAGQVLLKEARRILSDVERATDMVQAAGRGETGRLSLGFVGSAADDFLPRFLQKFRERYPEVVVVLEEGTTAQQVEGLRTGRLSAGLVRPPLMVSGLASQVVLQEALVVALPEGHPLTQSATVPLEVLRDEEFIFFPRHLGPGLYDEVLLACAQAEFAPQIVMETARMQTIVGLVAAGMGVSLVPASVENLGRKGVVYRPIEAYAPRVELALAWHQDTARPLLMNVLRLARELSDGVITPVQSKNK